jgi:membrane protein required for colicin V production
MVGKILKKIIDWTPFGLVDNVVGALIGIAKWALMLSILFWVMDSLKIEIPSGLTKNSKVLPWVTGFASQVGSFISSIFPSFENFINTLEDLFESFTS